MLWRNGVQKYQRSTPVQMKKRKSSEHKKLINSYKSRSNRKKGRENYQKKIFTKSRNNEIFNLYRSESDKEEIYAVFDMIILFPKVLITLIMEYQQNPVIFETPVFQTVMQHLHDPRFVGNQSQLFLVSESEWFPYSLYVSSYKPLFEVRPEDKINSMIANLLKFGLQTCYFAVYENFVCLALGFTVIVMDLKSTLPPTSWKIECSTTTSQTVREHLQLFKINEIKGTAYCLYNLHCYVYSILNGKFIQEIQMYTEQLQLPPNNQLYIFPSDLAFDSENLYILSTAYRRIYSKNLIHDDFAKIINEEWFCGPCGRSSRKYKLEMPVGVLCYCEILYIIDKNRIELYSTNIDSFGLWFHTLVPNEEWAPTYMCVSNNLLFITSKTNFLQQYRSFVFAPLKI